MTENCVENTDFAYAAASRPGHMPRQLPARLSGIRSIRSATVVRERGRCSFMCTLTAFQRPASSLFKKKNKKVFHVILLLYDSES